MTPMAPTRRMTVVPQPARDAVGELLATARREVLVLADPHSGGTDPVGTLRGIEPARLQPGVRCRVLVPDHVRLAPGLSTRVAALALADAVVRTVPDVPSNAVVVDGALALLPAGGTATGLAVFQLPGIVATVSDLFERIWPTAVPFTQSRHSAELTPRERELLGLLSTGRTDESAAARLDVSVRTVRRMVADIMGRLGARSRFQAGVKAADRGWLLEEAG